MSADKRSTHTDALETLGTIIGPNEKRDAIHLAVEPVIAGHDIMPGSHVTLKDGVAVVAPIGAGLGIVDPFIDGMVSKGERFWLVVYPRQITSLRHVWTHPAFSAGDAAAGLTVAETDPRAESKKWMREWAIKHMRDSWDKEDVPASEDEIEAAYEMAIEAGHDHCVGSYEDARDYIDGEWWTHWEIITGQKGDREAYFSCAC